MWVRENCHLPPYPFFCFPGPLRYVFVCGRLSGYVMWHTWGAFLKKLDDGSGVGLIVMWFGHWFSLDRCIVFYIREEITGRTLKSKRKLNLELWRGKETCFNVAFSVRSIVHSYADPQGWSAGCFCLLLSKIAVMCSLLTNKSPQFSEMIH